MIPRFLTSKKKPILANAFAKKKKKTPHRFGLCFSRNASTEQESTHTHNNQLFFSGYGVSNGRGPVPRNHLFVANEI